MHTLEDSTLRVATTIGKMEGTTAIDPPAAKTPEALVRAFSSRATRANPPSKIVQLRAPQVLHQSTGATPATVRTLTETMMELAANSFESFRRIWLG